jgi:putative membrane protein
MSIHYKLAVTVIGCAALLRGAALSKTDAQFMKMAAVANMTEAHLGQMAEAQAARQGVKDFGQKLSTDHTNAYQGLTELANKTGDTIPKAIGREQTIARLAHLKGNQFDRAFLLDEVHAHRSVILAFRHEAEHGENADVKLWAQNMIPTLEDHLHMAESLEKQGKSK